MTSSSPPEQPPAGFEYYFAFGANTNKLSLEKRHVVPVKSFPAKLYGWKIDFTIGTGNILPANTADCVHGVTHMFSKEHMDILDKFEGSYTRLPVTVQTYDGHYLVVTVYHMVRDQSTAPTKPEERYVQLIIDGCQQHGVDAAWIEALKQVPSFKRRAREEWRKLPPPVSDRVFSAEDLMQAHKSASVDGKTIVASMGGKVIRYQVLDPNFFRFLSARYGGLDSTLLFVQGLNDPCLAKVVTDADITADHRAFMEEFILSKVEAGTMANVEVIGTYTPPRVLKTQ